MTRVPLPSTMRAALCDAPGARLRVARVPVPQPEPGQYLVQIEACGLCHSDLHLQRGDEDLPLSAYPLILGHEGIGRIVQGEGPLPVGTRIGLPWLYDSCLCCDACLTGQENFCKDQRARGIGTAGAFAEFALVDSRFAIEIPPRRAVSPSLGRRCSGDGWRMLWLPTTTAAVPGETMVARGEA